MITHIDIKDENVIINYTGSDTISGFIGAVTELEQITGMNLGYSVLFNGYKDTITLRNVSEKDRLILMMKYKVQ